MGNDEDELASFIEVQVEETSVSNGYGEMQFCDCGGMELVVGPLTLHLHPDEVHALNVLIQAGTELMMTTEREDIDPDLH